MQLLTLSGSDSPSWAIQPEQNKFMWAGHRPLWRGVRLAWSAAPMKHNLHGVGQEAPGFSHGEYVTGVRERPPKVAALFDLFYEQLQSKEYDEASHTLDEIDSIRNYHDPEVAGCRVKLKLERMRNN